MGETGFGELSDPAEYPCISLLNSNRSLVGIHPRQQRIGSARQADYIFLGRHCSGVGWSFTRLWANVKLRHSGESPSVGSGVRGIRGGRTGDFSSSLIEKDVSLSESK